MPLLAKAGIGPEMREGVIPLDNVWAGHRFHRVLP